jgi:putative ABC transport system substrate-binding protein
MTRFSIADFRLPIGPTRIFACVLALGLLLSPLAAEAQQAGKVYRIGCLGSTTGGHETNPQRCPIKGIPQWQAFVEGLRERGYISGQNLLFECQFTEGREERAPSLAAELVSLKPDLIVAHSSANALAVKRATSAIPIVMVSVTDPVGRGLVASLAQPGGNVTGLAYSAGVEIVGKQLQILKEVVPKASRVAVLGYLSSVPSSGYLREEEAAAQALGVTLQTYRVQTPEELPGTFAAMTTARTEAFLVEAWPFTYIHRQRIVTLAAQSRLPGIYHHRGFVEAGGLLAYGVNEPDLWRRVGFYVDKIVKGAKPADLPVEQPTNFDLIINLKTAKALGLTIPQSLLIRADEVIE